MPNQKIYIIGEEETVLLFGLIGIDGIVLESNANFLKEFDNLVKDPSIGMVIISMELPEELTDYLFNFKLNNRNPFIFYLPDIFKPNIEGKNIFSTKIENTLKKIII